MTLLGKKKKSGKAKKTDFKNHTNDGGAASGIEATGESP